MTNDIERTVKDTTDAFRAGAGLAPLKRPVETLLTRLQDESDLCRNEGAADIANLLDEASAELIRLHALLPPDVVVVPRAWVETAVCPACYGSGGIPVQVGEQEWEQQQCQWCDEKKVALAAAQDKP